MRTSSSCCPPREAAEAQLGPLRRGLPADGLGGPPLVEPIGALPGGTPSSAGAPGQCTNQVHSSLIVRVVPSASSFWPGDPRPRRAAPHTTRRPGLRRPGRVTGGRKRCGARPLRARRRGSLSPPPTPGRGSQEARRRPRLRLGGLAPHAAGDGGAPPPHRATTPSTSAPTASTNHRT